MRFLSSQIRSGQSFIFSSSVLMLEVMSHVIERHTGMNIQSEYYDVDDNESELKGIRCEISVIADKIRSKFHLTF